ncbi:MAG: N-acetylmuramoyl-L-alanine amidase [Bacteroidales bacterium]|nr:N-acetylmuramoyl-L-alanine amidase [Bacteroidales bacterium]
MKRLIIISSMAILTVGTLAGWDFHRRFRNVEGIFGADTRYMDSKPLAIVIHHTAAEGCQLGDIDRYHRDSCGWECGFAYPYFVTDTVIYQVHSDTARTIHAGNRFFNDKAIAVCLSGNFEERKPTFAELRNLMYTVVYLQIRYKIPLSRVYYHGEISKIPTACCGKYLKEYVELIKR